MACSAASLSSINAVLAEVKDGTGLEKSSAGWSGTLLAGDGCAALFWTRDCINCKRNLGFWNDWAKKYAGTDVAVVSVHTPETQYERSPEATARFARQHGLRFPVAVDNDEKIWNAYGVESWPTEVLVDKGGRVRYEYAGELNWQGSHEERAVAATIESLRAERTARR